MDETTGQVERDRRRETPSQQSTNDPDALQAEIAQTRREMSETIDEIQERLAPERLRQEAEQTVQEATRQAQHAVRGATIGKVEEMTDRATRTANNWRTNLMETVKENPLPAAMIGLGLGWLMVESRDGSSHARRSGQRTAQQRDRYYGSQGEYTRAGSGGQMESEQSAADRLRRQADEVESRVSETTEQVQQRAREMTDEARARTQRLERQAEERAGEIRSRVMHETEAAKQDARQLMQKNPLAVGAAALALGIGVGLVMPSTRTEDELMGGYRDQVVDQAQHKAEQTMDQVSVAAEEAQTAAKEAMKGVKEEAQKGAENVRQRTEEAARKEDLPGT